MAHANSSKPIKCQKLVKKNSHKYFTISITL